MFVKRLVSTLLAPINVTVLTVVLNYHGILLHAWVNLKHVLLLFIVARTFTQLSVLLHGINHIILKIYLHITELPIGSERLCS